MPTLNWHKREETVRAATRAPYRLLEPVAGLSYGNADSENRFGVSIDWLMGRGVGFPPAMVKEGPMPDPLSRGVNISLLV